MLSNFTFIGRRAPNGLLFRGGTDFDVVNSIVQKDAGACVQFADAFTISTDTAPSDPTAKKAGPPNFRSVFLSCAGGPANGSGGITTQQVTDILNETGRGNVLNGTSTLTGTFFPGANELAVTPFAASGLNSFFANTSYIGGFSSATDTWFNGWACGLGGSTAACTVAPLPIQ
jgi:hypothetical protein